MPATAAAALASFIFPPPSPSPSITFPRHALILAVRTPAARGRVSFHAAPSTDLSCSSSAVKEKEQLTAAKIGKRVRVKMPLQVYHVSKAPELDLNGLEGVIKQYVGVWKEKRISANLPFKVEFEISIQGQPRPVKFFAHLKEDEFEYLPSSD